VSIFDSLKTNTKLFASQVYRLKSHYFLSKSLTVFCYHDITNSPSEFSINYGLNIDPKTFEYQIKLIKNNFNIIDPDKLLEGDIPNNAALITFDDGYKSIIINAIPILKIYDAPCLIFLNMGPINGEISAQGLTHYLCEKREDFIPYLKSKVNVSSKLPPFLYCSRSIIDSYLEMSGEIFDELVSDFIGPLPSISDIKNESKNNLVFFGNHLYHHDVPLLMSDNELVQSYNKNKEQLEVLPNYRDIFAFPFGQLGSCFSKKQIKILFKNGAKKVFGSSGTLNHNPVNSYLDRLSLNNNDTNADKIWLSILKSHLRTALHNK